MVSNTLLEWTNEQVIRLVNEYKDKPELWDSRHNLYRVQSAKYDAFCQLAETFDCDVTDLKKKLNSIFASHRREKCKVRLGGRSGWFLYSHLDFLPNHIHNGEGAVGKVKTKRAKKRRVSEEEDEEEVEEVEENDVSEHSEYDDDDGEVAQEIIIKEEPEVIPVYKPQYKNHYKVQSKGNHNTSRPRLKVLRRKLVKESRNENVRDGKILDTVKIYKKSELLKKKDECDSFGEYIAVSLRKHDERTQAMIKQAINNILFEQEMKKYNTAQYTVVLSGMEENPLLEQEA